MSRLTITQKDKKYIKEFTKKIGNKKFMPSLYLQRLLNKFRGGIKENKYVLHLEKKNYVLACLPKNRGEKIILDKEFKFKSLEEAEIFVFKKRFNEYLRLYR
jgi:hypothetical protein|tara:strand:+ start:17 stop:322 length:306 start_codon:yes stop_codon:yes gene_type:complete